MGSFLDTLTVTIYKNDIKQLQKPDHAAGRAISARDPTDQKTPPANAGGVFCSRIVNLSVINRKTDAEAATERYDNRHPRKPVQ